jgi:hypothetical protein
MSAGKTHADQVHIDVSLVRLLVTTQFPQWADLAIKPVEFGGWDNRTFHLGEHLTVRLPSAAAYSLQVEKRCRDLSAIGCRGRYLGKRCRWSSRGSPVLRMSIPSSRMVSDGGMRLPALSRFGSLRAGL